LREIQDLQDKIDVMARDTPAHEMIIIDDLLAMNTRNIGSVPEPRSGGKRSSRVEHEEHL